MISTEFPGADYVPFTPGEKILNDLAEPMTLEGMKDLTIADFWGLYIRNKDGSVKEALYNTHGMMPRSPEAEAQQAYRESLWADFSVATNRVEVGETLVLNMFGSDGWCVEATRGESAWTFDFKHSPKYGKAIVPQDPEESLKFHFKEGTFEFKASDIERIKGRIHKLPWSTYPRQILTIYLTYGGFLLFVQEPKEDGEVREHTYEGTLQFYRANIDGDPPSVDCDSQTDLSDHEIRLFLDFVDRHSRHLKVA